MKKPAPRFTSEAALCAAFVQWAEPQGWTAYAETAGWDILLVSKADGTQIGVEAKLRFNIEVLSQAVPDSYDAWREEGPDYRAILFPRFEGDAGKICQALGITAFHATRETFDPRPESFSPGIGAKDRGWQGWHFWNPLRRHELPAYVPDVPAGASGPVQLTHWKIAALRLTARLQIRGYLTRDDFKHDGIDPRRWLGPNGWLIPGAAPGHYVRGPALNFDTQHPKVFAEILEDVTKEGDSPAAVRKYKEGRRA